MLALIACICFALAALGVGSLGPILLVPLGLVFLAAHFVLPLVTSWRR